jgi:hypothetical protein
MSPAEMMEKLAEPFPVKDIRWRVSRSGTGPDGVWCRVLAYITARALQTRLDEVMGVENWRNEPPKIIMVGSLPAFACGLSLRFGDEWVTKWDVAEPTNIDSAKGGWSGANKRAGAQWGVGRYLYYLDEVRAETSSRKEGSDWKYGRLTQADGGHVFFWKVPRLPGWAMPREVGEEKVLVRDVGMLKSMWKEKYAPDLTNREELKAGFERFVSVTAGSPFPIEDAAMWSRDAFNKVYQRIKNHEAGTDASSDIPFA